MGEPIAISIAECAALMQVTRKHVYTLINTDPTFPRPFKVGGCTRILRAELQQWLANKAKQAREMELARQSARSLRPGRAQMVRDSRRSAVSADQPDDIRSSMQCEAAGATPPPEFVIVG